VYYDVNDNTAIWTVRQVMAAICYIGTSGWYYDHWRKVFYSESLPKSKWLEFYCGLFPSVELNSTFYRLPSENAIAKWRDSSPPGFVFSVKVSRFITHIKRLKNIAGPISNFMARVQLLDGKLGPLLYQLPQDMQRDDQALEDFVKILPKNARHVFEFRHKSWFVDRIFDLLRHYNVGLCIYDMPDFSTPMMVTSDFAYLRFHGNRRLYSSCYSDEELEVLAGKITGLKIDAVYAYFNNDAEGFAVRNAFTLKQLLEGRINKA
jgi:uncharacterized protein YecE (DUF72 family)